MSARDAGGPGGPRPGGGTDFDRWLAEGLAPDDHDRAAGQLLAASWRARRRALEAAAGRRPAAVERWRQLRWWAPLAVVTIAAVAVMAWPAPIVVDEQALAGAYLDAMGTLPLGAP